MFFKKSSDGSVHPALANDADALQSQVIDWLRFPLIVAVVFIHSLGYTTSVPIDLPAMHEDPFSAVSLYGWLRSCFSHMFGRIPVPAFFIISGYLLFRKMRQWDKELYLKKLKSRVRSLLVPYLCWNIITILVAIGPGLVNYLIKGKPLTNVLSYFEENGWLEMFWNCNVWAEDHLNWLGISTPRTGPIDMPLWFMRDLMVLSILTPLIYWFLKHTRHYGLLLLGLAYISGIWPTIPGLEVTSIFFFSAGAYFAIHGKNLVTVFRQVRIPSYIAAVLLLLIGMWFGADNTPTGHRIFPFFIIAGVCAAFNLAADLLERGKTHVYPLFAQSTFFIYVAHTVLLLRYSAILFLPLSQSGNIGLMSIAYLFTPILCVAFCICLFVLMRRWFPGLLGILMGSRNKKRN